MTCCIDFTNPNVSNFTNADIINILILIVNFLIFIVYAIMAKYMFKTFTGGQKQTEISLAINQYNIYHFELQELIVEGKNIKFHTDLGDSILKPLKYQYSNSNGIDYMGVFTIITHKWLIIKTYEENRKDLIEDFRDNVLFPLSRYYDKLFHFLNRIKNDSVLKNYKNILYINIENNILQTYFRLCNNCVGNYKTVDLSSFKTEGFDPDTFYRINKFYIENGIFQYKDLKFYQDTL